MAKATPNDNVRTVPPGTEDPPSPGGSMWAAPFAAGAAYLVFWQIAPRIKTESLGAVVISTILSLALLVWFPAAFARASTSHRSLGWSALFAGLAYLPLAVMNWKGHLVVPWAWIVWVPGLSGIVFIWFAASIGVLLSRIIRTANIIPPVAAVLALVDLWTVLGGGPVQQVMQSDHPAANAVKRAMLVRLPAPELSSPGASPMHLDVGFADFLFIAFFVAAICRLAPSVANYRKTLFSLIGALCAYMVVVMLGPWNLPALVPMAVVMILCHWRQFHYERSEMFALAYAALFIALIAGGFWYFGRQRLEEPKDRAESAQPHAMQHSKTQSAAISSQIGQSLGLVT